MARFSRASLALVLSALLLVGILAATAPAAKRKTYFPSNCTNARYKPVHLIAACGDAGLRVNKILWTQYGAKSALGGGIAATNTCEPSCAQGRFEHDSVVVRLFRPRLCEAVGIRLFTRLKVIYAGHRPPGAPHSIRFPFPCSLLEGPSG